ncbi:hypothetical protein [Rhizobium sp. BK251]|uniref:hypothetical protein n=1 Tax=Rhizobium sp. BK251 TaxID=2512125 RepID=UPI001A9F7966|nr:hypothetical protein [Rhizobium sp. BK251]
MLGLGFFDAFKIGAGVALGASLAFYPAKLIGRSEGRAEAVAAALSKSVEVLRERNAINDKVSASDAAALCADFFVPDSEEYRECLRRVAEADTQAGDGGNHHPD